MNRLDTEIPAWYALMLQCPHRQACPTCGGKARCALGKGPYGDGTVYPGDCLKECFSGDGPPRPEDAAGISVTSTRTMTQPRD